MKTLIILLLCYKITLTTANFVCDDKAFCDLNAKNDKCDSACNNLNCSYDSGDCLMSTSPWQSCQQASRCQSSFYNETCDTVCNTEACLYDQFKCKPLFTDDCIQDCLDQWGNGVCNSSCSKVQCGYDGNDCRISGRPLTGSILLYAQSVIAMPTDSARFVGFSLSLATRTIFSMKQIAAYNGTVPEVESLGDTGIRILYEVQNIPDCDTNKYTECWSNIQSVAMYSSAVSVVLNRFLDSAGINVTITKVVACQDLFYGENCDIPCSANCKSGCSVFDGSCIGGCNGEYFGDQCQTYCSPNCKLGCSDSSACVNGECVAGYTGIECTTGCGVGTYGEGCALNCSSGCSNGNCDPTTGTCSCEKGFNGTKCQVECPDGTYGSECSGLCGNCLYGVACDKVDGTCTGCSAGYFGSYCKLACLNGTHGKDCSQNCSINCANMTCDGVTGYCLEGCVSGWTGADCSAEIVYVEYTGSDSSSTTIAVTIGVVVGVVLVICITIAVVLVKQSKKSNYQSHLDKKVFIGEEQDIASFSETEESGSSVSNAATNNTTKTKDSEDSIVPESQEITEL